MRDTSFNSFLAGRKETRSASKITFSIVKVTNKTNSHGAICSEISDELSDFKNGIVQWTTQRGSEFNEVVKVTLSERQQISNQTDGNKNIQVVDESAKTKDLFQDNNPPGKKYSTTRIKSRDFLSNIAYVGINKQRKLL